MKTKTYVDANVLITAFKGEEDAARIALQVLDDPDRIFVISDYLRLEVLSKPMFGKHQSEIEFMEAVFKNADEVFTSPELTKKALEISVKHNIKAMDALHVGAAIVSGADEVVTMEKPDKPMFKVKEIKVISLLPQI